MPDMSITFWALGNVILSVALVTVNKIVMRSYGFRFVLVLSTCHFLATAAFLEVITRNAFFGSSVKRLPGNESLRMAAAGAFSIIFMNLSLQHNSIGFYQVTKLCIIPTVMAIDYFKSGKTSSFRIYLSIALLLLGVGIATVTDVDASLKGFICACLAVTSTAQFQIWQGSKQQEFGLSAIQITHSTAAPMTVCGLIASALLESDIVHHTFDNTRMDVLLILLTCILAMIMNITSYGLIGKTSATTFQVVGHAKTCLIIASGFIFYPPPVFTMNEVKNLCGLSIAIIGMVLYGHIKEIDNKRANGVDVNDCLEACLPGGAVTDVQLKERIFSEASEASEESKEPGIANQTDK